MNEHQQLEYKQVWHDEYLKWICGFANADGGVLEIGKDDAGNVVGLDNVSKLLEDIPNKVRDVLGIVVDVHLRTEGTEKYVEIAVEPHPYPVSYKGQYHYRSGSTKQELKGSGLTAFLLRKHGLCWDGVPVPKLEIRDFEDAAFNQFRTMALKSGRMNEAVLNDNNAAIIENLQLKEDDYIKRAAILLFYANPERFIPGAYIKIGFFRNDADLIYQDEVHGNLFVQTDKTMDLLLTKYMKAYISYEGIQRVERFIFPKKALREILLNAIIHKDYSSGIPIQISVYDNKVYCWNDGRLPDGWTVKRLLEKHPSKPFNPLIANTFFRAGQIESWGRGIEKIKNECLAAGVKGPVFKYEETGLMVEIEGEIPADMSAGKRPSEAADSGKMSGKVSGKTSGKISGKILDLIQGNPMLTIAEIAAEISRTERTVLRYLKSLQIDGQLVRVGSRKEGHWKVKGDAFALKDSDESLVEAGDADKISGETSE